MNSNDIEAAARLSEEEYKQQKARDFQQQMREIDEEEEKERLQRETEYERAARRGEGGVEARHRPSGLYSMLGLMFRRRKEPNEGLASMDAGSGAVPSKGMGKPMWAILIAAVIATAWFFLSGNSKPGAGQLPSVEPKAALPAALVNPAVSPVAQPTDVPSPHPPADSNQTKPAEAGAQAPMKTRGEATEATKLGESATALPAHVAGEEATASAQLPLSHLNTPAEKPASGADSAQLMNALQTNVVLQRQVVVLEERLARLEAGSSKPAAPPVKTDAASGAAPTTDAVTTTASRQKPARNAVARPAAVQKPSRPSTPKDVPPPQIGQLLAVDTWAGTPSVVIGTGYVGDQRTRILRPGDSLNGLTLQRVDAAAKSATFGTTGGRSFTLSVTQGS